VIAYALQWLRSLVFIVLMYAMMPLLAVLFLPWALVSRNGAFAAAHLYCAWVIWSARLLCGLRAEVRGTPPTGEVMVAAKHQSFLDILIIFHAVPRAKFVMKRELMYSPILGQYAWRMGCIPVNRGKRGAAIARMVGDVMRGKHDPGQLIIYPQGTRVAPGVKRPYKVGTAILYEELAQTCVPVATNVGLFWPKRAIYRKPGTAVVEFLPAIAPGLSRDEFLQRLEEDVETASDRLAAEAASSAGG